MHRQGKSRTAKHPNPSSPTPELSGLTVKDEQNPEGDIEVAVTGLRPGEKLYEELLIGNNPKPTVPPRVRQLNA